jgi:hypothetical protein
MASFVPIKTHEALTDLRSAAMLKASGQKGAYRNVGKKYMRVMKNPAKSMWDTIKGWFGGQGGRRTKRKVGRPKKIGRPRKHK